MNRFRFTVKVLVIATFVLAFTSIAQAQATRTWVSGVGDDVNPCSRTAPCKTFAGAISKTAAGGEIDALDPGGFGAVTITKSIVIDGTHGAGFGSILASGVNGVNVNDSATATPGTINVALRNLSINGAGTTLGLNGVNFTSGNSVSVEDCVIQNFSNAGVNVNFAAGSTANPIVTITDTIFRATGTDAVRATHANAARVAKVFLTNSTVIRGTNGLHLLTGGRASMSNTSVSHTTGAAVLLEAASEAFVDSNNISLNNNGISVTGGGTNAKVCNNTIVRNTGTGMLFAAGATANSCQDNKIVDNGANIAGGAFGVAVSKS